MVVISGEIWGYQSDAEDGVLLKAGDTFIQRGTLHAWKIAATSPACSRGAGRRDAEARSGASGH